MASNGKKNKKRGWKVMALDEPVGRIPMTNWAEEVDRECSDGYDQSFLKKEPIVLPTAPRASRAADIDETKIPEYPPFQVHLSSMPYDIGPDDLAEFFDSLKIKNIQVPAGNRARGFVEFEDRVSLIAALHKTDTMFKGRRIKIDLSFNDNNRGGMNRGGNRGGRDRDGGGRDNRGDMRSSDPDRTAGNWRSGPRSDDYDDRPSNYDRGGFSRREGGGYGGGSGGGGGGSGGGGGGGFNRGGYDRDDNRGFSREDFGRDRYNRDGDRGGRDGGFDRDRGFNRDDRGFSNREDRGGFSRDDRGYGGERNFRSRDDDRSRDERGISGQWRDEPRGGGFNKFDERRDRDRDSRAGNRREELPPPERGSSTEKTRPKLILLPKSSTAPAAAEPAVPSSSIFGGAKPVDTAAREREIEERLIKGDDVSETRGGKSGPGSTCSSQKDYEIERRVEPAPPPKENPWSRNKAASPIAVNNGSTSPDNSSHQEDVSNRKNWSHIDSKQPEKKDDVRGVRGPPPYKTGTQSNVNSDKSKAREEKPQTKHREPRKERVDDISKMPKVQEAKVPNFEGSNKFSTLVDSEDPTD